MSDARGVFTCAVPRFPAAFVEAPGSGASIRVYDATLRGTDAAGIVHGPSWVFDLLAPTLVASHGRNLAHRDLIARGIARKARFG